MIVGLNIEVHCFNSNDKQKETILKWKGEADIKHHGKVVTDIAPVLTYCPAEDDHQKYLQKRGQTADKGAAENIRCYG